MRARCEAKTKSGARCKAYALTTSPYCFAHEPTLAAQRADWRRHGGRKGGKQAVLDEAATVTTPEAVRDLLARTIDAVQKGSVDTQTANTISRLCSLQLKAIKEADLARRIEELERIVGGRR